MMEEPRPNKKKSLLSKFKSKGRALFRHPRRNSPETTKKSKGRPQRPQFTSPLEPMDRAPFAALDTKKELLMKDESPKVIVDKKQDALDVDNSQNNSTMVAEELVDSIVANTNEMVTSCELVENVMDDNAMMKHGEKEVRNQEESLEQLVSYDEENDEFIGLMVNVVEETPTIEQHDPFDKKALYITSSSAISTGQHPDDMSDVPTVDISNETTEVASDSSSAREQETSPTRDQSLKRPFSDKEDVLSNKMPRHTTASDVIPVMQVTDTSSVQKLTPTTQNQMENEGFSIRFGVGATALLTVLTFAAFTCYILEVNQ